MYYVFVCMVYEKLHSNVIICTVVVKELIIIKIV